MAALRCIRVLHIYDTIGEEECEDEPIDCHLTVVNLDHQPQYCALSYVWGPFQLLCDGVRLPITATCHSALWHLREKLVAFCILVDAVCIDQQSIKEKEQQIPLMGDIYAGASEVYIWLGIGSLATARSMHYLAQGGLEKYCNTWSAL